MRSIVLDTETTGLDPGEGHRIIELAGLELVDRRLTGAEFHRYLDPEREIDEEAERVHGISRAQLTDQPGFADVANEFLTFIDGAELIVHNARFDVAFLDAELARCSRPLLSGRHRVLDTLELARRMHPGQRNSLDALCARYGIDNSNRTLHGARLDADLLAAVYLAMTGGQTSMELMPRSRGPHRAGRAPEGRRTPLRVIRATAEELRRHDARLDDLDRTAGEVCLWRRREDVTER